jgi:hypothetical protein
MRLGKGVDALIGYILKDLKTTTTVYAYRTAFKNLADYLKLPSGDEAVQALVHMEPSLRLQTIKKVEARLLERLAPGTVAMRVKFLGTAVRKAHRGGFTSYPFDEPKKEYTPGGLEDILYRGLSPISKEPLRSALRSFAASQGFDRGEYMAAFQALIDMESDQARDAIARFKNHESKRGIAPATMRTAVGRIETAIRKAKRAGFTKLDIDPERPAAPRRPRPDPLAWRPSTPTLAKRRGPKLKNLKRNKFCYEMAMKGLSDDDIASLVKRRKNWRRLAPRAVYAAILAHCNANGLAMPPDRRRIPRNL